MTKAQEGGDRSGEADKAINIILNVTVLAYRLLYKDDLFKTEAFGLYAYHKPLQNLNCLASLHCNSL